MEELEEKCKHSSDMEKLAAEAERSSIKYKQVQFLQDKIGQEFDGVISGVTEWGLFIEISENHCEGMVRLKEMRDDSYYFDEDNYCVMGRRNKKKYTLGDKVRIIVKRADLVKKQLDFIIVESAPSSPSRREEFPKRKEKDEKKQEMRSAAKDKKPDGKKFNEEWGFEI